MPNFNTFYEITCETFQIEIKPKLAVGIQSAKSKSNHKHQNKTAQIFSIDILQASISSY